MKQIVKQFKTRVKEELIQCATIYKALLMDYEYLICSRAYEDKPYYIFYGTKDNFICIHNIPPKSDIKSILYGGLSQYELNCELSEQTQINVILDYKTTKN